MRRSVIRSSSAWTVSVGPAKMTSRLMQLDIGCGETRRAALSDHTHDVALGQYSHDPRSPSTITIAPTPRECSKAAAAPLFPAAKP